MDSLDLSFENPKTEQTTYNVLMVIGCILSYFGLFFIMSDLFILFLFVFIAEYFFIYKAKKSILKWIVIILFAPLSLYFIYLLLLAMFLAPAFG
jgi:hypothetical protein